MDAWRYKWRQQQLYHTVGDRNCEITKRSFRLPLTMLNMPRLAEFKHVQSLERNEKKETWTSGQVPRPQGSGTIFIVTSVTWSSNPFSPFALSHATNAYAYGARLVMSTNQSLLLDACQEGTGIRWNNLTPDWHSYRCREECTHQLFDIQPMLSSICSQNCHGLTTKIVICNCKWENLLPLFQPSPWDPTKHKKYR
jgi:hypothetical protein